MIGDLIQQTVSWLGAELPGVALELGGNPEAMHLDLPCAAGSDYRFRLWFYPDGERGISAELVNSKFGPGVPRFGFWAWTLELPDHHGSAAELARAFDAQVGLLMPVPTRIHQHRGWLFWTFTLEREAGSQWLHVAGCSLLRARIKAVPIEGRHRVYRAGPVASAKEVGTRA